MQVVKIPDFPVDATNVYRPREYIVRQEIVLRDDEPGTYLFSRDTYFLRTAKRDREFEELFADRADLNGRRIRTAMYVRTYIN